MLQNPPGLRWRSSEAVRPPGTTRCQRGPACLGHARRAGNPVDTRPCPPGAPPPYPSYPPPPPARGRAGPGQATGHKHHHQPERCRPSTPPVGPPHRGRPGRRRVPCLNRPSSRGPLCSLVGDTPRSRRPMTAVNPWSVARYGARARPGCPEAAAPLGAADEGWALRTAGPWPKFRRASGDTHPQGTLNSRTWGRGLHLGGPGGTRTGGQQSVRPRCPPKAAWGTERGKADASVGTSGARRRQPPAAGRP